MIIFTDSFEIKKFKKSDFTICLIEGENDLLLKIKNNEFPLLILTSNFPDINKFIVSYYKRDQLYDLVVLSSNSQDKAAHLLNNDTLAILTTPLLFSDFETVLKRYRFRKSLFLNKNCSQVLLKLNTNKFLLISDIRFLRAYGNYTLVFTSKERIMERIPFAEISNRLPNDNFIQTHRSFVVNINCISEIKQHSLKIGNDTIPISSRKKTDVIKLLEKHEMIV
jgi:DNA-binding LytR/AlgR family response regulator